MRITQARVRICGALESVSVDIDSSIDRDNRYSRGLSREGYDGGYAQALSDVILLLSDTEPNGRNAKHWRRK